MRWRKLGATLGVVLIAALPAGCTSVDATSPSGAPSTAGATTDAPVRIPTPSTSQASSTPSTAVGSSAPSASARVDPDAPAGQCADDHLRVSVQADGQLSGAGQAGSFVVFRNTGTSGCVLRGAPGVSLVGNGDGAQIGAAAARSSNGSTVTVPPGSYAAAELDYPNIDEHGGAYGDGHGHDPQCEAKAVDGYRVYPPHSFRAFFVRESHLHGCSTKLQALRVGTVEPPAHFPSFTPSP